MSNDNKNPGGGARRLSILAAGRDGVHAEDVESARRDDARVRHAGRRARRQMPGAMPFPNPAAMFAALDPVEIDRKIAELQDHRELADDERVDDADEHQDDGTAEGVARGHARLAWAAPKKLIRRVNSQHEGSSNES